MPDGAKVLKKDVMGRVEEHSVSSVSAWANEGRLMRAREGGKVYWVSLGEHVCIRSDLYSLNEGHLLCVHEENPRKKSLALGENQSRSHNN